MALILTHLQMLTKFSFTYSGTWQQAFSTAKPMHTHKINSLPGTHHQNLSQFSKMSRYSQKVPEISAPSSAETYSHFILHFPMDSSQVKICHISRSTKELEFLVHSDRLNILHTSHGASFFSYLLTDFLTIATDVTSGKIRNYVMLP